MAMKATKAGTNAKAVTLRREAFRQAYLSNGQNATQAAIAAGYSPKTAKSAGARLLTNVDIAGPLAEAAKTSAEAAKLNTERVCEQVRRIIDADPRKLFHPDGTPKRVQELDDDTAAAVASVETAADGSQRVKFWDKNSALEKAMKHLGLFESDNKQRAPNIAIQVQIVRATADAGLTH